MELSADIVDGLRILSDETRIDNEGFCCVLRLATESIVSAGGSVTDELPRSGDAGAMKQAHHSLVTLLLEHAKLDHSSANLHDSLDDLHLSDDRLQRVISAYEDNKSRIRLTLSNTGSSLPHITDVQWRLNYHIKNTQVAEVRQPSYHIELLAERPGESGTQTHAFTCSQEQLQDLVSKLKDACKSLERAAQS